LLAQDEGKNLTSVVRKRQEKPISTLFSNIGLFLSMDKRKVF
jgi:hypothetical protein